MHVRETEAELAEHVKKAISSLETAPKQKHVRSCIVFAWDHLTSGPFWACLKLNAGLSDQVVCYKALITIHKLLVNGPPVVLSDAMREYQFLESLARHQGGAGYYFGTGSGNYGDLIVSYVDFLKAKLSIHKLHPKFRGDFNYEEWARNSHGIKLSDLNEDYQTVTELMDLQAHVDSFHKVVINNFHSGSNNECRIASLVPLVEESYGIYNFITTYLRELFKSGIDKEPLLPLLDRYEKQFWELKRFYEECSNIRYLTSLINIPVLPDLPPRFFDSGSVLHARKPTQIPREEAVIPYTTSPPQSVTQRDENDLTSLKMQELQIRHSQDAELLHGSQQKILMLENELASIGNQVRDRENYLTDTINNLQEQINMWKSKYENMAKMYSSLRAEHLELLSKLDKMKSTTSSEEIMLQVSKLESLKREQGAQINALIAEKTKLNQSMDKIKEEHQDEVMRLKKEALSLSSKLHNLGSSVDTSVLERQLAEKEELNKSLKCELFQKEKDAENKYNEIMFKYLKKDEESKLLQADLDKYSSELVSFRKNNEVAQDNFNFQLENQIKSFKNQLDLILDNMLKEAEDKVKSCMVRYNDVNCDGNTSTTPQYSIALLEKLGTLTNEFSNLIYPKIATGQTDQLPMLVGSASELASSVDLFLENSKGLSGLSNDSEISDEISTNALRLSYLISQMLKISQSSSKSPNNNMSKEEALKFLQSNFNTDISKAIVSFEKMLPKDIAAVNNNDLEAMMADEMSAAAKAIQDAIFKLEALSSNSSNSSALAAFPGVNDSIIDSSMAIAKAIAQLLKQSAATQQEIVNAGKGTSTALAFYKKHNRWTEGLISAARAVAIATASLVETADGCLKGTHTLEQLIVCAQQVAAATAQLLSASRVKTTHGSKSQHLLDLAAKAVSDATKALVDAVNKISSITSQKKTELNLASLTPQQYKVREMEIQVGILKREQELADQRKLLAEFRKASYHNDNTAL